MQSKIKLCLHGYSGKMGQAVTSLLKENNIELALKLGSKTKEQHYNDNVDFDVCIDFSNASALPKLIALCEKHQKPLVLGTTGLTADSQSKVEQLSKKLPIVQASNFSIGMNLLFLLAEKGSALIGDDFDVDIVEQHHKWKKDAPSGSAKTLKHLMSKHYSKEIAVSSIRAGGTIGEHTVIFSGENEKIELQHTALNRKIFAEGAIKAALWLLEKKPSPKIYSMRDVLA